MSLTWRGVCKLARAFPGIVESTSYRTPALKLGKTLLVRLREDGRTLVIRTTLLERDLLLRAEPATFFLEEHYRSHPWILTSLSRIRSRRMLEMIETAWERASRE